MAKPSYDQLAHQFAGVLNSSRKVLIGTHMNPDGDTIGSALALSHYLDSLGKPNDVVCHNEVPSNLRFLPGVERIKQGTEATDHDLALIVDMDSLERLGSLQFIFERLPRSVVLDHHVPHEAPGDLRLVDTDASATAVILANTLFAMEATITKEMATCLLTGIVTDTGSFRFRNTNPEALSVAARLIEQGGDINQVSEEIYHRKPYSSVKLLGHMLDTMHLECDERLCWGALAMEDFWNASASDTDTEGFVNELLAIKTVQIAALLREHKPLRIRVSLRSRGDYDVAAVAREFGGGGHHNAAGCSFECPLSEAADMVVERLKKCLASS